MSGDNSNTSQEDKSTFLPLVTAAGCAVVACAFSAAALAIDEEESNNWANNIISLTSEVVASSLIEGHKRTISNVERNEGHTRRRYVSWDRLRAKFCIMQDYLGAKPTFGPDDFRRIFRLSRTNYDKIRSYLCSVQPFLRDGFDATKRENISSDAKILIALKYLANGTTVNAFRDYFQIGESTAMKCVKLLTKEIATSPFCTEFLRSMSSERMPKKFRHTIHQSIE
jgi:hypothetical protein